MKKKNMNVKVTRKQFQKAEERAIEEMANLLEEKSTNPRESANASAMMYLVIMATTKLEGLLFGEDKDAPRIEFLGFGAEPAISEDEVKFEEEDAYEEEDDIYSFGMGEDYLNEGILVIDDEEPYGGFDF